MTTSTLFSAAIVALCVVAAPETADDHEKQDQRPDHQVVAIYFHRTARCPTCKRIGALAEEAVAKGFAKAVKARVVEFHFVDFQDKKHAKLARAHDVKSPTLVLLNVFEGETETWTSLPRVWQLVGKPAPFRTYVSEGVARYLKQSKEDARKEFHKSKEAKE